MNFDGENVGNVNLQNDFSATVFEDIMFFLLHFFVSLSALTFSFSPPWLLSPFRNFKGKGAIGTSLECSISEGETPLKY